MANPQTLVRSLRRYFDAVRDKLPLNQAGSTDTFQTGEMIGQNAAGYATHFDDAASLRFVGIQCKSAPHKFDSTTPTLEDQLEVEKPFKITMPLSSGSASRATDIGKIAYAVDAGAVTLDPSALVYGNMVGRVSDVINQNGDRRSLTGNAVEIEPFYGNERNAKGVRVMAATGAQTITRFDLGKTILVPNTAALTLTLPPVAQTTPGDRLTFIKTAAAAFAVTLDGNAAETIDGGATVSSMDANHDTITIESDGSNWRIVCQKIA